MSEKMCGKGKVTFYSGNLAKNVNNMNKFNEKFQPFYQMYKYYHNKNMYS